MDGLVRVEPADERHAAAVQRLAEDPAIAATTNLPHPYPADGALRWAREAIDGRARGSLFAFVVLSGDTVVGVCSLMGVSPRHRAAELGYWIGVPYWGRGFATAGAHEVLAFGFGELRLRRVNAGVLDHNLASARVLRKLGFVPTGVRTMHEKGSGHTYTLDRAAFRT